MKAAAAAGRVQGTGRRWLDGSVAEAVSGGGEDLDPEGEEWRRRDSEDGTAPRF